MGRQVEVVSFRVQNYLNSKILTIDHGYWLVNDTTVHDYNGNSNLKGQGHNTSLFNIIYIHVIELFKTLNLNLTQPNRPNLKGNKKNEL